VFDVQNKEKNPFPLSQSKEKIIHKGKKFGKSEATG
jgi:hypothetical protein